jgi:hypothetical protein
MLNSDSTLDSKDSMAVLVAEGALEEDILAVLDAPDAIAPDAVVVEAVVVAFD